MLLSGPLQQVTSQPPLVVLALDHGQQRSIAPASSWELLWSGKWGRIRVVVEIPIRMTFETMSSRAGSWDLVLTLLN